MKAPRTIESTAIILGVLIALASATALIYSQTNQAHPTSQITKQQIKETVTPEPTSFPTPTPLPQTTLLFTGDVMLGRAVMQESTKLTDPAYPFRKTASRLAQADITFINLENPFVKDCPETDEGMIFCADPKMIQGLTLAGVDIVTLANNHSGNYGTEGINSTLSLLEEKKISYTGLGELTEINKNGMSFGFLGFEFVSKAPIENDFRLVKNSDPKVDVLIVSPHWGVEYTSSPTQLQRDWAKLLVEAGADAIIGHHPHWVQTYEKINSVPVYYSLGNFVFDQDWSEETKKGLVVKLTYRDSLLINQETTPIYMPSLAQPEFVNLDTQ